MKPTLLVCMDYETTSAEPATTRGVQFAAIANIEGESDETVLFNTITNPEVGISREAASVHGISQDQVVGQPFDYEIAKAFVAELEQLSEDYDIVLAGHNSRGFDYRILRRLAERPNLAFAHIDTLICASRLFPDAPNHKLSVSKADDIAKFGGPGLIQTLGLGSGEGAHDALADVRMVRSLVDYVSTGLRKSYVEMAAWCEEARVLNRVHFGKHRGKHWKEVPRFYLKFICEKFDDPTPDMIATLWEHHRMRFEKAR